jgi:hypothetical protein
MFVLASVVQVGHFVIVLCGFSGLGGFMEILLFWEWYVAYSVFDVVVGWLFSLSLSLSLSLSVEIPYIKR